MKSLTTAVAATLFALPIFAAPPVAHAPQPAARRSVLVRSVAAPVPATAPAVVLSGQDAVLANYLQLDADQRSKWMDIRTQDASNVKPLVDQQRDLQRQLQAALAAGTDACAIGELTLSLRRIGDQIAAAQNVADDQLSVLSPDQQMKYQAFQAAVAFLRAH